MTQRLNDKVDELQRLRTQNAVLERKLLNFHQLFAQGQEEARSIFDHETHEEVTAADAREQDHAAEMDAAAPQEPVDAAAVAVNDATNHLGEHGDQSRHSSGLAHRARTAKD